MMSESNADEMMSPKPEQEVIELEKLSQKIDGISRQLQAIKEAEEKKNEPDTLGWDDITQEIIGAVTFALPFLFTGELWDVAKAISLERAVVIFLLTLGIAYLFLVKSRLGNMKREELFHLPKRLISVSVISYTISALLIYLYDINGVAHFTPVQYLNATVIVSAFAVIGAIAVDMVK
ncbi:DUF2391 family protein [Thermococcus kodakarensis]|nr:DUF2391 family protein [Thermococcus kodakarensis]WCN28220.1 DUF2391 family protein [Thermococcus kodakarensis]WCN30516.1 DUF2391 family protein [Thermococcus kodakarensis]